MAFKVSDKNINSLDANELYLMSSENNYFTIDRHLAMLSGEIRDLLNMPGHENVRVLYFNNLSDEQIIDVIICMDLMGSILTRNNMMTLPPSLQRTREPLQINLEMHALELQRSVFNHSQHAEIIPESVKTNLLLQFGIEI